MHSSETLNVFNVVFDVASLELDDGDGAEVLVINALESILERNVRAVDHEAAVLLFKLVYDLTEDVQGIGLISIISFTRLARLLNLNKLSRFQLMAADPKEKPVETGADDLAQPGLTLVVEHAVALLVPLATGPLVDLIFGPILRLDGLCMVIFTCRATVDCKKGLHNERVHVFVLLLHVCV